MSTHSVPSDHSNCRDGRVLTELKVSVLRICVKITENATTHPGHTVLSNRMVGCPMQ